MCIIIAKPKGAEVPKEEWLRNSAENNSDGMGLMYKLKKDTDVHIKKDFITIEGMIKFLKENITKEDTVVFHFRLATSGLTDIGNRHPFPITNNSSLLRLPEVTCRQAVCHNGVLSSYGGHKKFSDTQKFIMDILCDPVIRTNLSNKVVRKLISSYIDGDKLAILSITSGLILLGDYVEEEGLYFSNTSYKERRIRYLSTYQENHWHRGLYGTPIKQINSDNKTSDTTKVKESHHIWTSCDGCKKHKQCTFMWINNNGAYLCKKCRRKARKAFKVVNKLEDISNKDVIDADTMGVCAFCEKDVPFSELKIVFGDNLVCPECYQYSFNDRGDNDKSAIDVLKEKEDMDCKNCTDHKCEDCLPIVNTEEE